MVIKFIRFLVNLVISAFVFLIIVLLIFDQFVQFRMGDHDLYNLFHKQHLNPQIGYYVASDSGADSAGIAADSAGGSGGTSEAADERKIRYLTIGDDTTASVLFVHGAPSSLNYWRNYLMDSTLLHHARLFAVDRPGYGYSGLAHPEPDIRKQALLLKPLLERMHDLHRPVILVGASYGTAVVSRLAMDNPGLVDGIVLVAPALAPGEEKMFWFTPAIEHPILRWFVPRMLQSANTEKLHHKEELEKMLPLWASIRVPVIYLQGADDELVYTTNANFARQHLVNVPYLKVEMIPKTGHLIAFLDKDRVEDAILSMIQMVSEKPKTK